MIDPRHFAEALDKAGISFVTGVPDSLLKDICAYLTSRQPADRHIIATNEGGAAGLAIGHFLATGHPALVYMQNSGLGNVVNPLASLADPLVFGIPMLLMIGWRGEIDHHGEQIHDEPQHVKQGQITLAQLDVMGIPYQILDPDSDGIATQLRSLRDQAVARSGPVALVIRKQSFSPCKLSAHNSPAGWPTREAAIQCLVDHLPAGIPIISTTGMASRELFEYRRAKGMGHQRDFLTVGGMGHASQIASGIALALPERKVVCLDGDGAILMHLGALAISARRPNMRHLVINNGAHDSVGGQPTLAEELDLTGLARTLGYATALRAESTATLATALDHVRHADGSVFVEIKCRTGARPDLGRPDRRPAQNKTDFMRFLAEGSDAKP